MAHKHLTYLDIPASQRRLTAAKSITRIKEALTNPTLTQEQRDALIARVDHVSKWAAGTLPQNHHDVGVSEDVTVSED